jgi:surfeit locus 1 family protein
MMQRFRPQLVPSIFFIISLAILLGLGSWQVKRLTWKNNLVEIVNSRIDTAPQSLPPQSTWKQLDVDQYIYRLAKARGTFDPKDEVHIFTKVLPGKGEYSGTGFWVIAPFYLKDGGVVLVNRGFVPEKFKQRRTRITPQGKQTITGIIKTSQGTNFFTPDTDFKRNIWFTRDIKAISEHLELKNSAPFMIALTNSSNASPLPQPRVIDVELSNKHLGYAVTWFGLALTLIGVFVVFSFKSRPE